MQPSVYVIQVDWDSEAQVWVAHGEDVPGLATGADTFEALIDKLRTVVPELLGENGLADPKGSEIPFAVLARRMERIRAA